MAFPENVTRSFPKCFFTASGTYGKLQHYLNQDRKDFITPEAEAVTMGGFYVFAWITGALSSCRAGRDFTCDQQRQNLNSGSRTLGTEHFPTVVQLAVLGTVLL